VYATRDEYRLRRLGSPAGAPNALALDPARQIRIGRSATCELPVDDPTASRKHALLLRDAHGDWCVYDLKSHNGTYVNGSRITVGTKLHAGDHIRLGPEGPAFSFERGSPQRPRLGGKAAPASTSVTSFRLSALLPILTHGRLRHAKVEFGVVSILTALVLAFLATGHYLGLRAFQLVLAGYLLYLTCSEVRRMTGRLKPWRELVLSAGITASVALVAFVVVVTVVGDPQHRPLGRALATAEEAIKAIPIIIGVIVGLRHPWWGAYGPDVRDPLDGIVIGAASAGGLEFVKALFGRNDAVFCTPPGGLTGIPAIIGDVAGDVAYSGFLGYIIGLAAITRSNRLKALYVLVGFAIVALVHSFAIACPPGTGIYLAQILGLLSFMLFIGAIGRARRVAGLSLPSHESRKSTP
jgi:RsiW-degrading membrane proteinase PrsW (M82 family)